MLELDTKIDALNIQSTTFKIHTLHDQLEKQHRERFEKYNKDILTKKKDKKLFRDKKAFQEERAYRWSDSYRASNLSNIYACAPYRTNNKTKIPQTPKFPTISQPALAPTNAHRRQKRSHPVNISNDNISDTDDSPSPHTREYSNKSKSSHAHTKTSHQSNTSTSISLTGSSHQSDFLDRM